jgi:hypothetical protein
MAAQQACDAFSPANLRKLTRTIADPYRSY